MWPCLPTEHLERETTQVSYGTWSVTSNLKAATYHEREKQQFHHQNHMLSHSNHKPGGFHQQQTIWKNLKKIKWILHLQRVLKQHKHTHWQRNRICGERHWAQKQEWPSEYTLCRSARDTTGKREREITKPEQTGRESKFTQHSVRTEGLSPSWNMKASSLNWILSSSDRGMKRELEAVALASTRHLIKSGDRTQCWPLHQVTRL